MGVVYKSCVLEELDEWQLGGEGEVSAGASFPVTGVCQSQRAWSQALREGAQVVESRERSWGSRLACGTDPASAQTYAGVWREQGADNVT